MKFDEIQPGMVQELVHELTTEDVRRFIDLTGDDNPLHIDCEYAAKTSFKKPVAHGMLGASFISTVIGTKLPGDGALWFAQNLEFLLPVRVGDTLTVRAEVIGKDVRTRVVELQTDIRNQYRQIVTRGIAKVKVVEMEPDDLQKPETGQPSSRVALVIGGSGGIGSATCTALAAAGFDVAVHYHRNADAANAIVETIRQTGRRASVCNGDVCDQAATAEMVQKLAHRFGPVSVLVNCSTPPIASIQFADLTWHDFETHLNNQIRGSFNLVTAVVPFMEKQHYGRIININSQALDTPSSNWLPYITAKGALMGFSRALAFDLAPKGIRLNSVAPGMTDTDQMANIPERVRLVTAAKAPLGRLAMPDDVAKVIVFLASDQSDYLCGETIRVNGGQVML
jgi:3-oxoacyl-[acyl-carrier protein] reductase